MKKLKILQVAISYAPQLNGIAGVVTKIAEGLASLGHDVTVLTQNSNNRRPDIINGVKIVEFDIRGNYFSGIRGDINSYIDFIKNSTHDVIHHHGTMTWAFDSIIELYGSIRPNTVFTPHGLQSRISDINYLKLLEQAFKEINMITCLSESFDEKKFCEERGIENACVIPNGVNLSEITPNIQVPRKKLNVVNISNHVPLKGHDRFYKLAELNKKHVYTQLGGSHPAGKYNLGNVGIKGGCFYQCFIKSIFNKNVKSIFNPDRDTTVANLRTNDVFAYTSYLEASPLVILEAMAAGKPWISFDVGNVRDHEGGIIVNSIREMSEKLDLLKSDKTLYLKLAHDGLKCAKEKHNWQSIISQYEELYYGLTSGN